VAPSEAELRRVLGERHFLLPSVVEGSGPFPSRHARWSTLRASLSPGEQCAVVSFYLALMTAQCLELADAEGEIVVEGPFTGNRLYLEMLTAATGRPVFATHGDSTGTAIGAALLAIEKPKPRSDGGSPVAPLADLASLMERYAARWRLDLA
jgi:sugar (pentulose or hexulose) kinase